MTSMTTVIVDRISFQLKKSFVSVFFHLIRRFCIIGDYDISRSKVTLRVNIDNLFPFYRNF